MDFQKRKLGVALWILGGGMLLSLLYHAWEGWGLVRDYPYNTFLCLPDVRYTDFTACLGYAATSDPYKIPGGLSIYFPSAFLLFDAFSWLPPVPATLLFLSLCLTGLYVLTDRALRTVLPGGGQRMVACVVFLTTYPVLYCLDRGNIEIVLVLLVGVSLYLYQQRRMGLSLLFLLPAICFKFYPAILLILYVRPRQLRWVLAGIAGFVVINALVLLTFQSPVLESVQNFTGQIKDYNDQFSFGRQGVSRSASAWSLFRLVAWLVYSAYEAHVVWQLSSSLMETFLQIYSVLTLGAFLFLLFHLLFIETSLGRRMLLLLLYITLSAPGGGDYKLMYVTLALVLLILIPERRRYDLSVVVLFAFSLLPKREILLPFMGRSDTYYYDTSVAIIVNPLCLLAASLLLLLSGWSTARPLRLRRQCRKLTGLLSLGTFRFPRT